MRKLLVVLGALAMRHTMGSRGQRFAVLALVGALALTGLAASSSAQSSKKRTYKFLVIGKVVGGEQSYQRDPYPNASYTLGGSDTSTWVFRWHVKVVFKNGMVYSPVANAFSLAGSAKGEYHGGYPRTNQPPAFYQCNWGPLAPNAVATKVQFYVTEEAARSVAMLFGVQTEPGALPKATCNGDAADPLVSTIVTGGVFTGIEQACGGAAVNKLKIPAKRFRLKKQFDFKLKFHWGPQSPSGQSRSCNGFGDPVLSGGAGTWRFHFRREK